MSIVSIPIHQLCVVTAADIEFKAVTGGLRDRTYAQTNGLKECRGRAGRNFVSVLQSEIGAPDYQEKLSLHLSATPYDALFIIGLAGALAPALKTGEVIFYDTCFAFRPEFGSTNAPIKSEQATVCDFQVSSALRQRLMEEGLQCIFGAGLTLDFMITTPEEKLAMGESYGAAAVDMESHDLITVGAKFGLPVVVLRVILDEATQKTPDFNLALDAAGRMNNLKALFPMLLRPIAAIQFFFSLSQAMKVLRRATEIVLLAEPKLLRPTTSLMLARKTWG